MKNQHPSKNSISHNIQEIHTDTSFITFNLIESLILKIEPKETTQTQQIANTQS